MKSANLHYVSIVQKSTGYRMDKQFVKIICYKTCQFCSLCCTYLSMSSYMFCSLEGKENVLFEVCDSYLMCDTFSFFFLRFVIERQSLDGTKKESVVTSALLNVEGLAVDWMGRNIYWTDEVVKLFAVQ